MWRWLETNWFRITILGIGIWVGVYSVLIFNRLTVLSDIQSDTGNISSNSDTLNRDENFTLLSNQLDQIDSDLTDIATKIVIWSH